ncbi:hypothetical protein D3C87_1717540 [compost metagenome]
MAVARASRTARFFQRASLSGGRLTSETSFLMKTWRSVMALTALNETERGERLRVAAMR